MFELDVGQKVWTLSRGQRARAGLLVAVAHRPELLLLDEPSSGLDPGARLEILAAIVRTVADEGRTVLLSSHLLHEVQRVADRVAMLHRGRLLLDEPLDDLLARHRALTMHFATVTASAVSGRDLFGLYQTRCGREQPMMMIHSVGYALTWEYWRRGMLWFVPILLGLAAGGILVMSLILALASWTALRRHYTLPVATTVLVAWSLANGALATVGVYGCAAMFVNGVLSADWPLIVPAFCSAAAYLACQTTLWWIGPSRGLLGLLAVAGLASLVVAVRLSAGHPLLFEPIKLVEDWRQVGAIGIAVWLGVVGLSYLLAVNGVARQRRGEAWRWAWLTRSWAGCGFASACWISHGSWCCRECSGCGRKRVR